jgi:hypothetical protein
MRAALVAATALALLLVAGVSVAASPGGHYIPRPGDTFSYTESYVLGDGAGDYTGYTEGTYTNGSIDVTAVASNGTESATYQNTNHYANDTGSSYTYTASGSFTFSAATFHYVQGTDNQSGYTDPFVWFYMNNSLGQGAQFYVLNSPLTVLATNTSFELASGRFVAALEATGTGTFQRDDVYGTFTADYAWNAYFDPKTGYIVGYAYTETDSNSSGDGFTIHDDLSVTSTSYPLTAGVPPTSMSPPSASSVPTLLVLAIVVVIVAVIVLVVWLARRGRRRAPPPVHGVQGSVPYVPLGPPPPALHLTPGDQPTVQQVVVRETVKVNCRYCGSLIDSTATVCPVCGAPRT